MRVLIAGASGGIGSACREMVHNEGHQTFSVDRPGWDIAQPGGAEKAVADAIAALGGLDGIVHAVGMSGRRLGDGPVSSLTDEGWSEILRVNLESAMRLMRVGIQAIELTFTTADVEQAARDLSKAHPDIILGIGTITTAEQATTA
jgi:NAD(P)-dependent dehydrogenase (short-subunit alcohol dehydrogenase family)